MDPTVAYRVVLDESADLSESRQSALELLVWIANGGAIPRIATTASYDLQRRAVISACELVLFKALDSIEGGVRQ